MLKKIFVGFLTILAALAVFIQTRPAHFHVVRSAIFSVPVDVVFNQVNDLHNWEEWSPWAKIDPEAKTSYSGPASGVGAMFAWAGNSEVGKGNMTITDSEQNSLVRFRLEFIEPFEGVSTAEFTFKPEGDETKLTWAMFGENNFVGKAIGLIVDCDKMIGEQFEKGLKQLRTVVEGQKNS